MGNDAFVSQVMVRAKIDGSWQSIDLIDKRLSGVEAGKCIDRFTDVETLQSLVEQLAGMCRMFLNGGKS